VRRDASRTERPVTAIVRRWAAHLTISMLVGVAHLVTCAAEELALPESWGAGVDDLIGAVARWGYR